MNHRCAIVVLCLCCAVTAHAAPSGEQTISAARLVEMAHAALPATATGMVVTTQVVGAPPDAIVQAGKVDLHADAPVGRWPRARVSVPVTIRINGKRVRTETVWFSVKALRVVPVYDVDAPRGTPVAQLKSHRASVDVAALDGVPVDALATLANERLKRGVHAGWPVVKSDFEPVPDVDKQGRVVVHVSYGPIRMEAVATALAAGNIGDTVSVLVEGASSPVEARVEAKGVVAIAR